MPGCDTSEAVRWLIDGASTTILPEEIVQQLCERMIAGGVPLAGCAVFIQTLHPELFGRCFIWRQGFGPTVLEFPYDSAESIALQRSVEAGIRASDKMVSLDPDQADSCFSLQIFRDLRLADVKTFVATPIVFSDGEMHLAIWTTRQPGGFSDEQKRGIENIVGPLARFSEIYALRRRAGVLLDTYVGRASGQRILAGQIRRGYTEALHAAIWLSDMRGFTELADSIAPHTLIDLLNRYFDCQVPAIARRGGEVLKFMGDGMLAVFPISESDGDAKTVCNEALAAAYEARAQILAMERGLDGGRAGMRFGVALHLGSVMYGNIGGERRLDFTCIGPAVNLAARIEKLTGRLGRTILASTAFAAACDGPMLGVGEFELAGFARPQTVFGVPDEAG
jgi:adenylate cyclase